ncbi:MAG: DUF4159 domain-containing protein [Chitinophagales bacterium]|nr:DUF4159 domain-containing protein [Chitinophagales bacterium]MDW8394408.1 DUF4159 domain-containing protein [Chitinophagales bacterium]
MRWFRALTELLQLLVLVLAVHSLAAAAPPSLRLALLKYRGGGDWYNDVNSLKNLALFCNRELGTNLHTEHAIVEPDAPELFNYPFVYMTGHGNFTLSPEEARNLRTYLTGGGFLFVNDDYGLDPYVRPALKMIFPELDLVEIPFSHSIYRNPYPFPQGLPKIHEHDQQSPRGYGLFYEGRMVVFYNHETDLGDGWDDVHNDPPEVRLKALQMGANIIRYVFCGDTL